MAVDFLFRLELPPNEKIQLKIRDDIQTSPAEVNLQSTDAADEKQRLFVPNEEDHRNKKLYRKQLSKQRTNHIRQRTTNFVHQSTTKRRSPHVWRN